MEFTQNSIDRFTPKGDHFICNIAMEENLPGGLLSVAEKDPRKLINKPDAYVGRVERVSERCKLVRPGDKIVVERLDWLQHNVDDERIIAREVDVIIINHDVPAPGVAVLRRIDEEKVRIKSLNLLPAIKASSSSREREYIYGEILHSNIDDYKPGNEAWILKSDGNQWNLTKNIIVFRPDDRMGLLVREKVPMVLEVA